MKTGILLVGLALIAAAFTAEAATIHVTTPSCKAPLGSLVYRCGPARAVVHTAPVVRHRAARVVVRTAPCHCRTVARASRRIYVRGDAGYAYAQSGSNYHSYSQSYGGGGYAWQSAPYGGEAVRYDLYRQYYAQPRTYQSGAYYGYNFGDGGPGGDRGDPWAGYSNGY